MLVVTRVISVLCVLALGAVDAGAQQQADTSANGGQALGMSVQGLHDNFALAGFWTSPVFLDGNMRVAAGGGIAWFPNGVTTAGEQEWIPFGHSRIALELGRRIGVAPFRLYGFGGATLVFLPERLSDDALALAGVGGFGFEFFQPSAHKDAPVSFFIEVGGVGGNARVTTQVGRPILLNGLFLQSGVRFYP